MKSIDTFEWKFYHAIYVVVALLFLASIYASFSLKGSLVKAISTAVVGMVAVFCFSKINYKFLNRYSGIAFASAFLLLVLTLIFGRGGGGRSLNIGSHSIQTFYITTFLFIFWLCSFLAPKIKKGRELRKDETFFAMAVFAVFIAGIAMRNLSTAILLCVTGLIVLFVAGAKFKYLLGFVLILGVGGVCYLTLGHRSNPEPTSEIEMVSQSNKHENRSATGANRVKYFFTGKSDVAGYGFQSTMSKTAIARSFSRPTGPGKGIIKEQMPEGENDYVFAMICEELSIIAGIILAVLYFVLFYQCFLISKKAKGEFIRLLSIGIGVLIVAQAYIHIAVNVDIMPATGQTLPFISRGIVNMLVSSIAVGILINMAKIVDKNADNDEDLSM